MIFVIAAIQRDRYRTAQGVLAKAVGAGNLCVSAPYQRDPHNPRNSAKSHAEALLCQLADLLDQRPLAAASGAAVIVVDPVPDEVEILSSSFFPMSFVVQAKFPDRKHGESAASMKNLMMLSISSSAKRARSATKAACVEMEQWLTRTPLLLPLKNFQSDYLFQATKSLAKTLGETDEPEQLFQEVRTQLENVHPRVGGRKQQKYYVDSSGVRFCMPGRHLHGIARPSEGHPVSCFLNGLLRLGGAIKDGFHYDCTKGGQPLTGTRQNCHGELGPYTGRPHLNIAPNDFIRE